VLTAGYYGERGGKKKLETPKQEQRTGFGKVIFDSPDGKVKTIFDLDSLIDIVTNYMGRLLELDEKRVALFTAGVMARMLGFTVREGVEDEPDSSD